VQFFSVSKGSLGEVKTQLLSAKDLGHLLEIDYLPLEGKRRETKRLSNGLMKSLV
jgi:four helix bundle protein